ncbi:hypothetical protein HDU92_003411 [Lobulomyces angularis]|nr:hypothetical protein HDU92_003411 [Lobulomyces angularis]
MSIIKAAATSSTLFALGDVFAQTLIEGNEIEKLDLKRTTNFFIIGGLWHGPWFFTSLRYLDKFFKPTTNLVTQSNYIRIKQSGKKAVVSHVTVFPPYLIGFISFLTVLDGGGLNDVTANVIKKGTFYTLNFS